ncbi:hypothetical protein GCM10018954_037240 [Kutzneria kofuensis]
MDTAFTVITGSSGVGVTTGIAMSAVVVVLLAGESAKLETPSRKAGIPRGQSRAAPDRARPATVATLVSARRWA